MSQPLIADYDLELDSPACVPGADRWSARALFAEDIEQVLPYLNARLEKANYDRNAKALIWKHEGHKYAFRPREIQAAPAQDREEARQLIQGAIALVNETWVERGQIEPDNSKRSVPDLMRIFLLLPRNNCGKCGFATCMAFSAALRADNGQLTSCVLLDEPAYSGNRKDLYALWGEEK
jgi:ArsR family metal-binding transcriptional regulator